MRGRKKTPTKLKELKGSLRKCREVSNEMQTTNVVSMPQAPSFLNQHGADEWDLVTNELANIKMLHLTDLSILAAYCNEIGIYREIAQELQGNFTEQTVDKDGRLRASKIAPKYKVMQNALQNAMKIATQFGFTPSSRASLSMPEQDEERTDDFNFFD
jgi:P27 family predicted phage terminase small subunit